MNGGAKPHSARVLIVKLSSLGDLFHALPAVRCLKAGLNAEVDWVTHSEYAELVGHFADVSRVIPFPRHSFWSNAMPFIGELRRKKYDFVIDLQGLLKSAMVTRLARGHRRIGPSFLREGTRLLYPEVAGPRNRDRHAVEQNLDVVSHLGLQRLPPAFPIALPEMKLDAPRPRVALVPFSRWPSKDWPGESFVELGRRLAGGAKATLFILGGPADAAASAEMARAIGREAENLAGRLTLVEMGGVLKQMDLVISNDSGPAHMAVTVGAQTLTLFGPTDPARTGPYGAGHRVIRSRAPCQPCFSRECELKGTGVPCVAQIAPETVEQAALEMLEAADAPERAQPAKAQ